MRKLKFIATITLKDDALHVRLIVDDANNKTLFDQIGRTKKLTEEQLKKLPSDAFIIEALKMKFKDGIPGKEEKDDLQFEKIKNNLE